MRGSVHKKIIPTYFNRCLPTVFIPGSNLKSECAPVSGILEHGKKLYSQYDEELIIRDFFNDRREGIFLDVGSSDYKRVSTTYYLEKHLGWSGIAVDALAEFTPGYIKNRPNTRFFSFIVTDHSGAIEPFYRVAKSTPLSSTSKEWIERAAEDRTISQNTQVVYVQTITLADLLEKNGTSKIDFLSIDIEGGEKKALATFDIDKFKPELVCIEGEENEEVFDYFLSHDYELIEKYLEYDDLNWYFKPKK